MNKMVMDLEATIEEIKNIAETGTADDKKRLVDLLNSDSPSIVEFAQNAIVGTKANSGKKGLIKKLMDVSVSVSFSIKLRSNSFDTLKRISTQNGNFLLDYVGKNSGKYDRIAAELIRHGNFKPRKLPEKTLIVLAGSSDEITRANAIESIGILKLNPGKLLVGALNDNFFVLSAAVFSIGELKLKSMFPKLKEMFLATQDRVVRNIIIESLSKMGGDEVADFFLYLSNNNVRFKLDKIYILKSFYKICFIGDCDKNTSVAKKKLCYRLSEINLKISIFSLLDYEERDTIDSILCYFSLFNHKKSRKIFKFMFDYYQKTDMDELEYVYVKNILKKITRPKYIMEHIKSLSQSSDLDKIDILIDVLSEIMPGDIINLLDFYKDRKFFIEIKLPLLKYAKRLSSTHYELLLSNIVANDYMKDVDGDVRRSSVALLGHIIKDASYIEKFFTNLLMEKYSDVIDAYIETLSNFLNVGRNKKYIYFFIDNLSLKNIKATEYSLTILGNKKRGLNDKEILDLYAKFLPLKHCKSVPLKRLLAKVLKKFDLINHKGEMSFLLEDDDEEVRLNYLESLLESGEKDSHVFFDFLSSVRSSDIFRYKIIELIQKLGNEDSFKKLVSILCKEKNKMVKIALLRALRGIDKEKSDPIIKEYSLSIDKDLRDFSLELIKN